MSVAQPAPGTLNAAKCMRTDLMYYRGVPGRGQEVPSQLNYSWFSVESAGDDGV